MLAHMRYDCGVDKQFKCSDCYRKFAWKHNLQKHVLYVHKKIM